MNAKGAQDTRSGARVAAYLDRIRIVLIDTSHPGNIGSAARAMKVMGLKRLHLVSPKTFPSDQATALASGADDLLENAVVHENLDQALEGCSLVLGTSARLRSLSMSQMNARRGAVQVISEIQQHDVAILFGREKWGLTNEEMQRCHFLVHIPANEEYSSLNLSQAVQVLSYELRMAALQAVEGDNQALLPALDWEPVDGVQMEGLFEHLEQTLLDIKFLNPKQPKRLMMRLRRMFNRTRPDQNELNILRGILAAAQETAGKPTGVPRKKDSDES